MTVNVNETPAQETVNTTEGKTAVDSLITTLNSAKARNPLAFSPALLYASNDWLTLSKNEATVSLAVGGTTT